MNRKQLTDKQKNYGVPAKRRDSVDLMLGKVPPQAKELEGAVLGAIMLESNAFDLVIEILQPECFYVDANQRVFSSMKSLAQKSKKIDLLTVVEELILLGDLENVGGAGYVSLLTHSVVSSANIEEHARIIQQKFIKRELIRISGEAIQDGYDDQTDVFDAIQNHDAQFTRLTMSATVTGLVPIESAVMESYKGLEMLRANTDHITGVPSGFVDLDKVTHGWQGNNLIIIGARPSMGKTAFSLNLTSYAATHPIYKNGRREELPLIAFFSLEMSKKQLANRLISAHSGIELKKIISGRVSDAEMKLFNQSCDAVSRMKIHIDDTTSLGIMELTSRVRRLVRKRQDLGMIVVDYLQLMTNSEKSNREQEVSSIGRGLKAIAKDLNIPVIALAQLKREVEGRGNPMPKLSDLRESGSIEQDADLVIFLHRPEYYDVTVDEMGATTKNLTQVKVAKHRDGALEVINLRNEFSVQRFHNMDEGLFTDAPKQSDFKFSIDTDDEPGF